MVIAVGERVPEVELMKMGGKGPETVALGPLLSGRKVVIFAVPAAFSTTCDQAHVPSFIRTRSAMADKGVDDVICVSVNDAWVMQAWGDSTGANDAGITMLGDPMGQYAEGVGMKFDAPVVGLMGRVVRHAMLVEDGVVKALHLEEGPGVCERTAGEAMLAEL